MISLVPAPTQLSKYDLVEQIGHGGMATVFRARDTRLQRDVALKLLHPHLRESAEIEARFTSEAQAVAKLRHPNIVAVFDVSDEDEDERYLVMELVRGITLRQLLKTHKSLPVELAAAMMLEVAAALEHAHEEGVIHRDVKPENVMIDMSGAGPNSGADAEPARVKLMDFGIAKLLDAQGVTSTGQVLGSPAHMAPEQIEGCRVDKRADVFSLGVMFYETVVGKLPFAGNNPAQVLRNVLEGNFELPDRVKPEVGARWSRLLSKALQRSPDARQQSIAELSTAVKAELDSLGMGGARHEIAEFLRDPAEYEARFEERIVVALSRSGAAAKKNRDVLLATAQFNRALAYRPTDANLLAQISGLRWQARAKQGLAVAAGVGLLGAVVYFGATVAPKAERDARPPQPVANEIVPSEPSPGVPEEPVFPEPETTGLTPAPPIKPVRVRNPERTAARPKPNPVATAEEPEPEEIPEVLETRRVSVRLSGAVGGAVQIDGVQKEWFGVIHELPVGEHLFEFVPPNDTCCTRTSKRVVVKSGRGVQMVRGEIPFKDATLAISTGGKRGWLVSCPTLFGDRMQLPSSRSVAMNQGEAKGVCTLTNSEEESATLRKTVTLIAGQTTKLTWP